MIKKIILILIGSAMVLFGIKYFTPKDLISNAWQSPVGVAFKNKTDKIKGAIRAKILPKTPETQRQILINDLKTNLTALENKITNSETGQTVQNTEKAEVKNTEELIKNSEQLVQQLEQANKNQTIGQKLTDKILNAVFPEPNNYSKNICH